MDLKYFKLLPIFITLPLLSYVMSLMVPRKNEKIISWGTFSTVIIHLFLAISFVFIWVYDGSKTITNMHWTIYKTDGYEFFIEILFDEITAVFLLLGSFLTSLVTVYSRYYLHREKGYKRFFNTLLLFFLGYNVVILSGNLETLFTGWEILGISSFLLVAFYRDRYLPVKNAIKVFSIYRLGDIGLILVMWLTHHIFHANTIFASWSLPFFQELIHEHSYEAGIVSVFILIAASAKSGQLPFSSWLPRAMEGPTPSSAIFYGSLSVHMGAFILLRTHEIWNHFLWVKGLVIVLGVITTFVSTGIARVQSSVKSQIAYSSIAQIGIIFCEIALGWHMLALIHILGNAILRTYQLLTSPSVVTYLMKDMFYNFKPQLKSIEARFPRKLEYTFYVLGTREFTINMILYRFLWNPMKWVGRNIPIKNKTLLIVTSAFFLAVIVLVAFARNNISENVAHVISIAIGLIGLVAVFASFTERQSALRSWILVCSNHLWVAMAVTFNENYEFQHNFMYLSGVIAAGFFGYLI
ncbi:MAG: proton-conducting transporter membrane subunit, partial [Bacteroidota bacterium]